jgi:hypothetical protein
VVIFNPKIRSKALQSYYNIEFYLTKFIKMSPVTNSESKTAIAYTAYTIIRATRALCCSPFKLDLFLAMIAQSVPLPLIAGQLGIEQNYTRKILSENRVDSELGWLIQVGLLRREVDGQGITDSFRLTPLGKQIVNQWQKQPGEIPLPSWWDRLANFATRWLRLNINN